MEWKPYDGPIVDLEGPHFHPWILAEIEVPQIDGTPGVALVYSSGARPYHNRMTARNQAKYFADPKYGKAGIMVLKCTGKVTCPAWTQYLADQREVSGADDGK